MSMQIDIPDESIKYLNKQAKTELLSNTQKYIDDLLKESSRLEVAGKTTEGDPEITSSMVKDAALLLKRGYKKSKKETRFIVLQIAAVVSSLITGFLFDFEILKEPIMLLIFILIFSVALTTTTLVIVKE